MKKLSIGISIAPVEQFTIWSSGHNQNIAFLLQLLMRSPAVERLCLLNAGSLDAMPPSMAFDRLPIPLVRPHEVTHEIDLVIEMGALLSDQWLGHVKALGAKVVTFLVGNSFAGNMQAMLFGREGAVFFTKPELRDEIWTLPQYEKSCIPFLKSLTRRPVLAMPHIWSPMFLEAHTNQRVESAPRFGFDALRSRQESRGWRVGIFEPNISVTKSCFIPMLVCDHAYRTNADCISSMMVMNSFHMKDQATFFHFASHLELTKDKKASYEPRFIFSDCMADFTLDAVVCHHWENEQNYLYYDALYGGYPVIHNSDFLQKAGVGIHYPDFSAKKGGDALLEAWKQPPEYWQDYKKKAHEFLKTLHPEHPDNIRIFTERLLHVCGSK
jgi:hypothetical protein